MFYGKIEFTSYLRDREQKMIDVDLLAGDIRHFTFLADKSQQWSAFVVSGHFDYVVDPVSVEPVSRRQHDTVTPAVLQFVTRADIRVITCRLFFRDELIVITVERQNASGGSICAWHSEVSFAGHIAQVADRRVAVILVKFPRVQAHAAAHPTTDQHQRWPNVARVKRTVQVEKRG